MASLFAPPTTYDPTLASLFASSSGPVKAPERVARVLPVQTPQPDLPESEDSDDNYSDTSSVAEPDDDLDIDRPRKRRRVDDDDLEASYFRRLADEEDRELQQHHHQRQPTRSTAADETSSEGSAASEDPSDQVEVPVHESLNTHFAAPDKSQRTVFLSNVSISAIKSKSSKKILLDHLESPLPKNKDSEKTHIESIRFRSTAYVADAGPKRAAFAKKELMDQTALSTNAYVVFFTQDAAQQVAAKLNGSLVLDRHLRIDNLANPGLIDHKRCVFVGNLPFMNEEQNEDKANKDEFTPRRAKAKQPADVEEGLWRAFSKIGNVENVRVVRDKETRVSKGFAYVQFANENGVEAALLLDGKKFPPMLPRTLRVSRAKRTRPTSKPGPRNDSQNGRRAFRFKGPGQQNRRGKSRSDGPRADGDAKPSKFVFEGHRASNKAQRGGDRKKRSVRPVNRSAKRAASFRASGGKKKRDRN